MTSETPSDVPDETPARLRALPTWVLSRAHARSHRMLADGFAETGLRGHDYRLLAALEELGPTSQASLARRTGVDRSDVVASLNDLAARGYVKRSPDPDDGRRNVISVTTSGRRKLGDVHRVVLDVQEQVLAPLSRAERKQLVRLLARLADHPPAPAADAAHRRRRPLPPPPRSR